MSLTEVPAAAITVRPARSGDDATISSLIADYAADFAYELGEQDVMSEAREARRIYEEGAILVAEADGAIVGCVAYEPWGEGRARMKRMYVQPEARGRGIGRALALAIMDHARGDGNQIMVLDTTESMEAARALYADLGFAEWEPDYEAPCRGTVYMRREL